MTICHKAQRQVINPQSHVSYNISTNERIHSVIETLSPTSLVSDVDIEGSLTSASRIDRELGRVSLPHTLGLDPGPEASHLLRSDLIRDGYFEGAACEGRMGWVRAAITKQMLNIKHH